MHTPDSPDPPGVLDPPADAVSLKEERDAFHDRWLRLSAEFDNYRKRTERERRELSDAIAADVVRDLLPAVDDLERALASAGPAEGTLRAGVELIHRQILDGLRRRGVEPFDSVGRDFDPAWHEAVASEPAGEGRRDGEIVAELRRGYRMSGRLLRAAQVKVATS
jgi:molecular chaperone GrpE